jgi:hypothetical protein
MDAMRLSAGRKREKGVRQIAGLVAERQRQAWAWMAPWLIIAHQGEVTVLVGTYASIERAELG